MHLQNVLVFQNDIRDIWLVKKFMNHLAEGRVFRCIKPRITFNIFPDWKWAATDAGEPYTESREGNPVIMIHDGHHRCVSAWLHGITRLWEGEYQITRVPRTAYEKINMNVNWVTPINPATHVRTADFWEYKQRAMVRDDPYDYIGTQFTTYAEPRKLWTLEDLAGEVKCQLAQEL